MRSRSSFRVLLAATVALVGLTACSSNPASPNVDAGVRIAAEGATVVLLERSGNPAATAARVLEVIALVKTHLLDNQTTVGDLNDALLQRIGQYQLDPGEKMLALELVNTLSSDTEKRVGAGLLKPEDVTTINKVLGYVESTASLYVSKPR
jgi:hypothetical protein